MSISLCRLACITIISAISSVSFAQSTAIIDGIGLSNGKSYTNYIKNPNAQKNVANVTAVSGSTITRVAGATALYQGTEFSIDDTNAWGAEWSAMALNPGLKNRLCEVQILAKSDAADAATLEVLQNSVAVFSQSLTLDASNPKKFGGTFPCGDLTYTSSVKLSGTSNPGAVKVAAVYLGEPVSVSSGAVVTEWQSYTPTFEGLGTVSGLNAKYRRVGSNLEAEFAVTGGTHTGSNTTISIPSGLVMANNGIYTVGSFGTTSTPTSGRIDRSTSSDTKVFITAAAASTTVASPGTTWANGTVFGGSFSVPISGWAATDIVTPEASISGQARYTTNSANTIATGGGNTVIDFEDKGYDINNEVVTGSSWKYTAKTAGYYQVNAKIRFANSQSWTAGGYIALKLYKTPSGGAESLQQYSDQTFDASTTPAQGPSLRLTDVVYLAVGDALQLKAAHGEASDRTLVLDGTFNQVSISKVTGPGTQAFYLQGPTKGGNSGNAIPTGYVGEKVAFTAATISATTGSWVANATPLYTLPAGRWQVTFYGVVTAATGATMAEFTVASNSNNDSTGFYSEGGTTVSGTGNTNGVTSGSYRFMAPPLTIAVTTTHVLYAKATTEGANRTVVVRGYAIRLD